MDDIIQQLLNSEHILIASHIAPDGDAVGSTIAMSLCCRALNKKTTLYNESRIPAVYRFLSGSEHIVSTPEDSAYDTAVILDCGDFHRIGNWKAELRIQDTEEKKRVANPFYNIKGNWKAERSIQDTEEKKRVANPFYNIKGNWKAERSIQEPECAKKTDFNKTDLHSGQTWVLRHQISGFEVQVSKIINIDHHVTNTRFGDFHIIDTDACATAEIVYRLIRRLGIPVDKALGSAIYTGIFTDTGSFRFSNTNRAAFEICEEMVSAGVDPYTVAKHLYGTYSLGRIKLLNLALDSIELSLDGKLSMMTVTSEMFDETGTQSEDTDGLINYARWIKDVKVAALIQECRNGEQRHRNNKNHNCPSQFHVSLRSDGSVDVAAAAAAFGGGGHHTAAGFSIEISLAELKAELFKLANSG